MHKNQDKNFAPEKQRKWKKRTRNRPKRAKPGAFWVLEGMGTVENGSNQMRKPSVRTRMNPIPMQHMKKGNRRKPSVFAGFVAGAEGLEPSARGFGVDVETNHGKQGKAGVARFSRTSPKRVVLVWCYGEIFRAKTGKKEREIPGKTGNALTKIDTGRIIKNAGQTTLG